MIFKPQSKALSQTHGERKTLLTNAEMGYQSREKKNLSCSLASQTKVSLEITVIVEAGENWEGRGMSMVLTVVTVSWVYTSPRIHLVVYIKICNILHVKKKKSVKNVS